VMPMRMSMRWPGARLWLRSAMPLHGDRAFDRIDHARELREQAVSHQLEDTPTVLLQHGPTDA